MTNTSNANITKASKNAVFHEDLDNNHQSDEQLRFACNQSQSQVAQARLKGKSQHQCQIQMQSKTQSRSQTQSQSQLQSQTQTQAQSQTQHQQPSRSPKGAQPKLFTKAFICIALTNFAVFFSFQLTTVGMPVYLEQLGADELAVGLTVTLVTAAALLVRPFAGLILDSFGRKGALITGIILMLFVIVAYLLFPLVGVVLALRIFHGVGWGLSSTSTSTIVADVIPKVRFAEGMGWYALGGSLSAAIGPALSIFLLEEVGAQAMIFVASASLGIAFVLSLFVEDQAMPDKNNQAKHESAAGSASSASRNAKPKLTLDSLIERDAWLPSLEILLVNVGFAAITAFIAVYGMAQGVANISLYFVVYSLVTIVSRPIIGRIIDQKGFFVPSVLGTLCVAVTLVTISVSHDIGMFCIAGVFAGLGLGTVQGAFQTMAVSSVPPQRKGVATSTFLIGLDGGLCWGSAIAGVLAVMVGYSGMFAVMALFPFVATIFFVVCYKKWDEKRQA